MPVGTALLTVAATVLGAALAWAPPAPADSADVDATGIDATGSGGFEHYVALGDSYTAGPLIPVPAPGPLGCVRSSANYPAFLASHLGVETFTDVSCSAARTEHLRASQTGNLPVGLPENENAPQLLALTEQTDLVTLGIGGNDFALFGELIEQCAARAEQDPQASTPCKDFFTVDGVDTKKRDARAVQANIDQALRDIRARAPEATVVVVNYLHILPETGTCDEVPFAEGDYAWGTEVQQTLNASLEGAAAAHGATYVDMYAASVGRDACAGADAWVNSATTDVTRALSFHPFRSGMEAIADATFETLTGRAAPTTSIPELQLVKRLPALIDVGSLLTYVLVGGDVPPEVVDDLGPTSTAPVGPTPGRRFTTVPR